MLDRLTMALSSLLKLRLIPTRAPGNKSIAQIKYFTTNIKIRYLSSPPIANKSICNCNRLYII